MGAILRREMTQIAGTWRDLTSKAKGRWSLSGLRPSWNSRKLGSLVHELYLLPLCHLWEGKYR